MDNKKGFTLLELIMAIGIIAIIAAVAIPNIISWLPNMRLKAEARNLYSAMQKARMEAVKKNIHTAIIFDPANNSYSYCDNWDKDNGVCTGTQTIIKDFNNVASGIGYGHGNSTEQATGNPWPLSPDDDVSYSSNRVVFNFKGTCNAGYVYLDHKNNTTTYAIGTQSSGVIKLKKWYGGSDPWK